MKTLLRRNVLLMLTFLLLVITVCLIPLMQPDETAPAATAPSTQPSTAAPTTVPPQTTLPPETTVPPTTQPLPTVDPTVSITAKHAFVYNCSRDHLAYRKDAGNTVMLSRSDLVISEDLGTALTVSCRPTRRLVKCFGFTVLTGMRGD